MVGLEIIRDLISQSLQGDELLTKFAEQRQNIKKAVGIVIEEADEIYCERETSAVQIPSFPFAATDSSARALVFMPVHGIASDKRMSATTEVIFGED